MSPKRCHHCKDNIKGDLYSRRRRREIKIDYFCKGCALTYYGDRFISY